MSDNISDTRQQIIVGFHLQFAENQRSREESFLKFLALLGGAIAAYAYVYHSLWAADPNFRANVRELHMLQTASAILLGAGVSVVLAMANNFRRDQFVNARIRKHFGLLGADKLFPPSYDPSSKISEKGPFLWMPELFKIFYLLLNALQVLALTGYVGTLVGRGFDPWGISVSGLCVVVLAIGLYLPRYYRRNLTRVFASVVPLEPPQVPAGSRPV